MILVTGATGFIGAHLIDRLCRLELPARTLVRPGTPHGFLERRGLEVVEGDVTQPGTLRAAVAGCRSVVHLVGLLREPPGQTFESVVAEGTRSLVEAAEREGLQRFVYVSAVGTRPDAPSRYHRTKWLAEQAVRGAACEHVIVRPSVVYGPGDDFVNLFANSPLPLPGGGSLRVQPVYVGDLVTVVVAALRRTDVAGRTFELGGPDIITMKDLVALISRVSGRVMLHPPMPLAVAEMVATACDGLRGPLQAVGLEPPLSRDQLRMLEEDNVCDVSPVVAAFGLTLTPLVEGLRSWLAPAPAA